MGEEGGGVILLFPCANSKPPELFAPYPFGSTMDEMPLSWACPLRPALPLLIPLSAGITPIICLSAGVPLVSLTIILS